VKVRLRVRRTKTFGRGVYAAQDIAPGAVVMEFDGATYGRSFARWTKDLLHHVIQIGPQTWRDSRGPARWTNHSCEPNCGIKNKVQLVAMRRIRKGEQITWDYEMTEKSWWWRMKCQCGTARCRGVIGSYARMPVDVRRRYRGFISEWLLEDEKRRGQRRRQVSARTNPVAVGP
jgi:uncharacterized protein